MSRLLPYTQFHTEDLPTRDRLPVWRESISVLYDVAPADERPADQFQAAVGAYLAGGLFASQVYFTEQRFERSRKKLAADGIDHYQIQLYESGGEANTAEECRPGDVQLLDLGRPHEAQTKAADSIVLMVARDAIREMLPEAGSLHHAVLRGESATGGLLADYLRSLMRRLPAATEEEAPAIEQATMAMIAACFRPTAEAMARAGAAVDATVAERVREYIERNLGEAELGPEAICRAVRISRTRLYALFEDEGGVARYIWRRRLARAYAELASPARRGRTVGETAYEWGFTSAAHFTRAFRKEFGVSPSEVPAGRLAGMERAAAAGEGYEYEEWIRIRVTAGA
jgi:AraC-like DNA-binding protein